MDAIHIRTHIDSTTVTLPELKPLVGKSVEITIREDTAGAVTPGSGDWSAWKSPAIGREDYDFDAWRNQREIDRRDIEHRNP